MLAVEGGGAVRQLPAHQLARLPHDDAAIPRLVPVIQQVVDLESVVTDDLPDLVALHGAYSAQHCHHDPKRAQVTTCVCIRVTGETNRTEVKVKNQGTIQGDFCSEAELFKERSLMKAAFYSPEVVK